MTRDELLRAWVAALEGEKYKQGEGALRRDGDRYCCLGVLCDLSGEGLWVPALPDSVTDKDRWVTQKNLWGDTNELPQSLASHVGVTDAEEQELVSANDNGERFPQIAQRIRRMFPDVFPVAA